MVYLQVIFDSVYQVIRFALYEQMLIQGKTAGHRGHNEN